MNKTFIFCIIFSALLFLLCGRAPLSNTNDAGFSGFTCDFENSDLSLWQIEQGKAGMIEVVEYPVLAGNKALRVEVLPNITWGSGNRSELALKMNVPFEKEMYYRYSLMLDSSFEEGGEWQIMGQWHDQPDINSNETWSGFIKRPPPVSIHYSEGRIYADIQNWKDNYKRRKENSVPIEKGKWVDILVHVLWSMDNNGFVAVWVNGYAVTPFNGKDYRVYAPTAINRAGNYFKIGLYRDQHAKGKAVLYYDEIRIGTSLKDVMP